MHFLFHFLWLEACDWLKECQSIGEATGWLNDNKETVEGVRKMSPSRHKSN